MKIFQKYVIAILIAGSIPFSGYSSELPACNDKKIDLRKSPKGFACMTSKGTIYKKVVVINFGEAWQGPIGGRNEAIWSDIIGEASLENAMSVCRMLYAEIPPIEYFISGSESGFEEVLPNIGASPWTASLDGTGSVWAVNGGFWSAGAQTNLEQYRCIRRVYSSPTAFAIDRAYQRSLEQQHELSKAPITAPKQADLATSEIPQAETTWACIARDALGRRYEGSRSVSKYIAEQSALRECETSQNGLRVGNCTISECN